jgi:phage shock protein PspC (stress-responsive transcriptional regulator)
MKKVTNITLGGFVFVIEDEAYEKMSTYLSAIEQRFSKNEDYKEIVQDIENAIAEKFMQAGKDEKHAVTEDLVAQVILEMGNAEDLATDDTEPRTEKKPPESTEATETVAKRFFRDPDDVIVAGVASGIARYFDIDPVIIRLLFVISVFLNGFGIFAYIILWLVVPKAETTAQKYAMRGERMTLHEITEHVKKKLDEEVNEKRITQAKGLWTTLRGFLENVFSLLGKALQALFHVLRYIVGFAIIIAGALGVAGLVSILSVLWVGESAWLSPELQDTVTTLLSDTSGYVLLGALFTSLFIPLLFVIILGGSLLAGKNLFTITKTLVLGILWITALTLTATFGLILKPTLENVFDDNRNSVETIRLRIESL